MKVVLINAPWAEVRLKNISEWFGLDFVFNVQNISLPFVPMQEHPTMPGLAVLDMGLVNLYKDGFTLFVAPYQIPVKRNDGGVIGGRASVNGIYLSPAFSFQRWEWWASRLFWNSPAIEVFANEDDQVWTNGKVLGNAFEVWARHEFSHWLKRISGQEDTTHKWFYSGEPEKVLEELNLVFKRSVPITTDKPTTSKISAWAKAIEEFESGGNPNALNYRRNNPGNIKGIDGSFLMFKTYDEGRAYLEDYLTRAATGRHKAYKPTFTLRQFFATYAPDGDVVIDNYTGFVARKIGVFPSIKISELV